MHISENLWSGFKMDRPLPHRRRGKACTKMRKRCVKCMLCCRLEVLLQGEDWLHRATNNAMWGEHTSRIPCPICHQHGHAEPKPPSTNPHASHPVQRVSMTPPVTSPPITPSTSSLFSKPGPESPRPLSECPLSNLVGDTPFVFLRPRLSLHPDNLIPDPAMHQRFQSRVKDVPSRL